MDFTDLSRHWQRDFDDAFDVVHRVSRAARRLGYRGDPHHPHPPAPKRLEDLQEANRILTEAKLNNLPERLLSKAKRLAQTIVMTSGRRAKPLATEATIIAKTESVARKLGLDGGVLPERHRDDLTDDGMRVTTQLVDRFIFDAGPSTHHDAAWKTAMAIVANSDDQKVDRALWRLRNAFNPLKDSDERLEELAAKGTVERPFTVVSAKTNTTAQSLIRRRSRR